MARVLVSMTDEFLKEVDRVAQNDQRTRSELIREALRTYIKRQKIASPKKANEDAGILENLLD